MTLNDLKKGENAIIEDIVTDFIPLKLIEMGEDRYKLMEDNPEYFAPKENFESKADNPVDHPNRYAYKKLFNHLKSEGIV